MMNKLNATAKEPEAGEPCLPKNNSNNSRKSMEDLNRTRDQEDDTNNSSVLLTEKKRNDTNNYQVTNQRPEGKTRFAGLTLTSGESKFESWCKDKTGYTRFGLIVQAVLVFLLLVFMITVVIMACLWPSIPHSFNYPLCRTSACLLASSQIVSRMDQSVDPCVDLRKFSCGSWLDQHFPLGHSAETRGRSLWSAKTHIQHKHREKVRDMISTMTTHTYDPDQIQLKVKNMYESCMSLGSIETERSRPLKKVITQLGGWRVLRDFSLSSWDVKRTWKNLHKDFSVQPFFHVDVVPHPLDPLQSIIQISPGSLGLPDKMFYFRRADDAVVIGYKRYLKDVAMTLGATSDDASSFADDVFGFEKRLAERFPHSWSHPRPHPMFTIATLQKHAPSIPFLDILSAMFPNAKLTMNSHVIAVASDHFINISRIISATDRSLLNDYMMWRLAVAYTPYLSQEFRNATQQFQTHLYGSSGHIPRWELCVEVVEKYIGLGLEAILENQHSIDLESKQKVVKDMFSNIRNTMKNAVQNSRKLNPTVKEHFLDKIKTLEVEVGLPVSMRYSKYYNDYYRSLTTHKDDFFKNIEFGVTFLLEEKERRLKNPSEEHRWMDSMTDGQLKVTYVPEINKIIVPFPLLSMPYFHVNYPPVMLYGGLGSELGLAMIEAITGRGLFHAGDGAILPRDHPLSNFTHDCFLHHPSPVPRMEAIHLTFQTLDKLLETQPHTHQPALEQYEDNALFFIIYAQSLCTLRTQERVDIDMTLNSQLDDTLILNAVKSKSGEFKSAFSCHQPVEKDVCLPLL